VCWTLLALCTVASAGGAAWADGAGGRFTLTTGVAHFGGDLGRQLRTGYLLGGEGGYESRFVGGYWRLQVGLLPWAEPSSADRVLDTLAMAFGVRGKLPVADLWTVTALAEGVLLTASQPVIIRAGLDGRDPTSTQQLYGFGVGGGVELNARTTLVAFEAVYQRLSGSPGLLFSLAVGGGSR
jgi:hypothetical protein